MQEAWTATSGQGFACHTLQIFRHRSYTEIPELEHWSRLESREASSAVWSAQGKGLQLTWLCIALLPATTNSSIFYCKQHYGVTFPLTKNSLLLLAVKTLSFPALAIPSPKHRLSPGISVSHPRPAPASSSYPAPLADAVSLPFPSPCS